MIFLHAFLLNLILARVLFFFFLIYDRRINWLLYVPSSTVPPTRINYTVNRRLILRLPKKKKEDIQEDKKHSTLSYAFIRRRN